MKKLNKTLVLITLISLLPIIFGVLIYDQLPDQVPTQWNFSGEIDGWSSKATAVFGMPCFMAAVALIIYFALNSDPKRKNMPEILVKISMWICPVLSMILVPSTILAALGYEVNIKLTTCLIMGIVFLVIGNYLPKCKQSYTMGIRIPWTLNSEENWNRTHRMAGKLWIIAGISFFIIAFIDNSKLGGILSAVLFSAIIIVALIPMVYSYILYKKGI